MDVHNDFKFRLRNRIRDGYIHSSSAVSLDSYLCGIQKGMGILISYADKDNLNFETMCTVKKAAHEVIEELRKDFDYESSTNSSSK